ncbi:MAG TPA: cytochrome c biogenesis protein CcsA, partial [Verrucomicrobiales bacterium]|nr:cytochrome c biogenesis protein CcsA [Verrucomicrobiales bacterium]
PSHLFALPPGSPVLCSLQRGLGPLPLRLSALFVGTMDLLTLILATATFLCGFILAVRSLRSESAVPHGLNIPLAIVGLIFQSLFLQIRGELHGRCPITSGAEILVFVSWSIVIMYLVLGKAFRLSLLGVFTMPMVFLFQSIAIVLLLIHDPGARPPQALDPWLELHAAMSLLAYGAYALSGVAGVMYFVQDRQLKSHHPGRLFYSMPPIRYLTAALVRLLVIGTILLTIGLVAAFLMKEKPGIHHLLVSGAVWVAYVAFLLVQWARSLPPKQLAVSAIIVFTFALLTLVAL